LAEGYRRALTHFNEDEIRALFVSGAGPLADLGLDSQLDRALAKLHGGLADVQRRAADKARSRIHLDGKRWNQPQSPRETLVALRRAVWDDRRLEISYEDRQRARTKRRIDPLGLVSKAGVWYLIARSGSDLRSFRVERIVTVRELGERFERPADFDLERYWSESTSRFERDARAEDCTATVVVRPESIERITGGYWPSELVERSEDFVRVRVTFPHVDAAVLQLVAWSDAISQVEPAALRDAAVARARQALASLTTCDGER
jgi:predicted DNA-binding transcriptional regulator YafY